MRLFNRHTESSREIFRCRSVGKCLIRLIGGRTQIIETMKSTRCPACLAIFDVPASYIGRDVSCPSCKKDFALTEANCANESAAAMRAMVGGGSPDSNSPTASKKSNRSATRGKRDSVGKYAGCFLILGLVLLTPLLTYLFFTNVDFFDRSVMDSRNSKSTFEEEVDFNNDVHGAWAYTQQFVEKRTDPKPADFPSWSESFVTPLGKARYLVTAYVDTENAFGGKVRLNFNAIIVRSSDSGWTLESLNFLE